MRAGSRPFLFVAVTASLLATLAACSSGGSAGSSAASRATMSYCGGSRQERPTVVEVICATNDITARRLAWTGWGDAVSTAMGTAVVDLCAFEDCHTGSYTSIPVVLVASRLTRCARGTRAYSRLQYVFVGASPFRGLPASMSFKNFDVGSARPGPPANQTVSLSC